MVDMNNNKRQSKVGEGSKNHSCVNCEKSTITARSLYCIDHFEAFLETDKVTAGN